jgi:hypothetical protein
MTFQSSFVSLCIGGFFVLAMTYMAYRIVQLALRTKGDVSLEMSRGKILFKLEAKDRK